MENKNTPRYVAVSVLIGILVFIGCIFYDSHQSANSGSHDVTTTIQQVKDESSRARTELNNARTELQYGQERAAESEETTGRLQDSNDKSRAVIEDSRRIIEELRTEFRDIDQANGIPKTQTGSKEQTK